MLKVEHDLSVPTINFFNWVLGWVITRLPALHGESMSKIRLEMLNAVGVEDMRAVNNNLVCG